MIEQRHSVQEALSFASSKQQANIHLSIIMTSISTKKDKGAAPEANVCAHCLAPEGSHGVVLKACTRYKATHYCGRACQSAHWRAGHKQFCVTPEERAPQPVSTSSTRI